MAVDNNIGNFLGSDKKYLLNKILNEGQSSDRISGQSKKNCQMIC